MTLTADVGIYFCHKGQEMGQNTVFFENKLSSGQLEKILWSSQIFNECSLSQT